MNNSCYRKENVKMSEVIIDGVKYIPEARKKEPPTTDQLMAASVLVLTDIGVVFKNRFDYKIHFRNGNYYFLTEWAYNDFFGEVIA